MRDWKWYFIHAASPEQLSALGPGRQCPVEGDQPNACRVGESGEIAIGPLFRGGLVAGGELTEQRVEPFRLINHPVPRVRNKLIELTPRFSLGQDVGSHGADIG